MTSDLLLWSAKFWKVLLSYTSSLFNVINFKLIIIYSLSTSCNHAFCTARVWTHHVSELPIMAEIQKASPSNGVRYTVNPLGSCYIWVLNDD